MAKKSVGYVRLEWTCPACGTRNPGPQQTCSGCGAAQPENVQFEQAAQEELIKDEAELARAQAGPDIHCGYCGTRNPSTAKVCRQCGGDLTEGKARAAGAVLGAHRDAPVEQVPCATCGTLNPATALQCAQCGAPLARPAPASQPLPVAGARQPALAGRNLRFIAIGAVVLFVAICGFLAIFLSRTEEVIGTVESASWTRTVQIEGLVAVEHEDWHDEIPSEGIVAECTQRVRRTQDEPEPGAREVCGTPYTVDGGDGFGEVVQDCKYEVYDDWCTYTVDEWQRVDTASVSGGDLNPYWPALQLGVDQREGQRGEQYECIFTAGDATYTYSTSSEAEFAQCEPGTRWVLNVNPLGGVRSIEPAR